MKELEQKLQEEEHARKLVQEKAAEVTTGNLSSTVCTVISSSFSSTFSAKLADNLSYSEINENIVVFPVPHI